MFAFLGSPLERTCRVVSLVYERAAQKYESAEKDKFKKQNQRRKTQWQNIRNCRDVNFFQLKNSWRPMVLNAVPCHRLVKDGSAVEGNNEKNDGPESTTNACDVPSITGEIFVGKTKSLGKDLSGLHWFTRINPVQFVRKTLSTVLVLFAMTVLVLGLLSDKDMFDDLIHMILRNFEITSKGSLPPY
jgi:hypothetical protein